MKKFSVLIALLAIVGVAWAATIPFGGTPAPAPSPGVEIDWPPYGDPQPDEFEVDEFIAVTNPQGMVMDNPAGEGHVELDYVNEGQGDLPRYETPDFDNAPYPKYKIWYMIGGNPKDPPAGGTTYVLRRTWTKDKDGKVTSSDEVGYARP